jgi:hypothetical protein
MQQLRAIKELKGHTGSLLMPEVLLDLWHTCGGYLTPKHAILGPHAPFKFLSLKEAQDLAGQLMTRANHSILTNPAEVSESEVAEQKVLHHPVHVIWLDALLLVQLYAVLVSFDGVYFGVTLRRSQCYSYALNCAAQELDVKDKSTKALVEVMLAWPSTQGQLYEAQLKQQVKFLADDAKNSEAFAKAAQETWTKATSDLNRVRSSILASVSYTYVYIHVGDCQVQTKMCYAATAEVYAGQLSLVRKPPPGGCS